MEEKVTALQLLETGLMRVNRLRSETTLVHTTLLCGEGTVVSFYKRLTCGVRYLFQGSRFSEATNHVYKFFFLHRMMDMEFLPRQMRRALDKARGQQGEDDMRVNHQLVLRLEAARL